MNELCNEFPHAARRASYDVGKNNIIIRSIKKTIVIQRQADLGKHVPPDTVPERRFFMHVSVNEHAFERYQQKIIVFHRGGKKYLVGKITMRR